MVRYDVVGMGAEGKRKGCGGYGPMAQCCITGSVSATIKGIAHPQPTTHNLPSLPSSLPLITPAPPHSASADITSTMADTGSALSTSPNLHGSGSLLVRSRRLRAHTHTHSAGQVQAASANVRAVGPAGPPHSPGPGPVGLAEMGEDGERGGHVGNGVAGQGQQEGKAGESCEVGNSNDSSVKMGGSRDHTWSSDPEAVDRHSSMHIANKSRSSNSSTSIEHSSCRSNNHSGSHGVGRSAGNGLLQKQDSGQGGVLSPLGALSNVEGDGVVVAGGRPDGLQQQLQRVGGEEPQMPPTCACSIM